MSGLLIVTDLLEPSLKMKFSVKFLPLTEPPHMKAIERLPALVKVIGLVSVTVPPDTEEPLHTAVGYGASTWFKVCVVDTQETCTWVMDTVPEEPSFVSVMPPKYRGSSVYTHAPVVLIATALDADVFSQFVRRVPSATVEVAPRANQLTVEVA